MNYSTTVYYLQLKAWIGNRSLQIVVLKRTVLEGVNRSTVVARGVCNIINTMSVITVRSLMEPMVGEEEVTSTNYNDHHYLVRIIIVLFT